MYWAVKECFTIELDQQLSENDTDNPRLMQVVWCSEQQSFSGSQQVWTGAMRRLGCTGASWSADVAIGKLLAPASRMAQSSYHTMLTSIRSAKP